MTEYNSNVVTFIGLKYFVISSIFNFEVTNSNKSMEKIRINIEKCLNFSGLSVANPLIM